MREIRFYRTSSGRSPVDEFLNSLSGKQVRKVMWVFRLVENLELVPAQYLKKLNDTGGIWEIRVDYGGDAFRFLGFFDGSRLVILTNGFAKKTEKVPQREITVAEERRRDYLSRENDDE